MQRPARRMTTSPAAFGLLPPAFGLLPRRGRIEEGGTVPQRAGLRGAMAQNGPKWRTWGKYLPPPLVNLMQSTSEAPVPFRSFLRHISRQSHQFQRRFRANTGTQG